MKTSFLKLSTLILFLSCSINIQAQEQCLINAWESFKIGDYKIAIASCDECIGTFKAEAIEMQTALTQQGKKDEDFPIDTISDLIKKTIFDNWAINNIATAYFVKAISAEQIYRRNRVKNATFKQIANEAYNQTCTYSFGRCWDPQGWFWNPCEETKIRGGVRP